MADNPPEIEFVTKEIIEKSVQVKEKHENISIKSFNISPGSEKGDNYVCVILAVTATAQQGEEEKEHRLIVKTASKNVYLRHAVLERSNLFETEVMTYKRLISDMTEYQKQKGRELLGPSVPRYYHSIVDKNNGILVLEDLREDLYKMAHRQAGLDNEHCKLVMKEVGVFHALSWALKKDNPDILGKYSYLSRDSLFETEMPELFVQTLTSSINLVKVCSDRKDVKIRVEKLMKLDLYEVFKRLIKPVEPYAVICHGDLWCNNLLFKYSQNPGPVTPTRVKLLDFQISRYALPTTDLAYFLYLSTTRDTRQKHQTDLLRLYHSTFIECLNTFDVDFPAFTFDVLERLFVESALFGILFACIVLPLILSNIDDVIRFDTHTTEEELLKYTGNHFSRLLEISENNIVIKERLIGAIEDAIDMNLI